MFNKKKELEMTERTANQTVKHKFTPEEQNELQRTLARKIEEVSQTETDKKAAVSQFTARINQIRTEVNALAVSVNQGYTFLPMECRVIYYWKKGTKETIHPETGEILKEEKITESERQEMLPIAPGQK